MLTTVQPTQEAISRGPEAERRHLTVMFCDLVGSTALSERLDPEEYRQVLDRYRHACVDVVSRFDGQIAKYIGDGLLIYFGYPQAHEDDPERAVRAGLGVVASVEQLDSRIADSNVDLAVRIGITTGLVVAGDIGSGEGIEREAIVGGTPNLAARLQDLAKPNTVVIGASTQRLVEGLFDCSNLGAQRLKGISQPVRAYQVEAESPTRNRFEAKATRGLSPLVGREEEISLLCKRWTQAMEGESQVVLLSGEGGVGKSRIVRAFQESLAGEVRNRVLYYCSAYHKNSALNPAIDQMERALRFKKGDNPERKLDKLETTLRDLGLATADLAPMLASLLALQVGDRYPPLTLRPDQLKRKTLEALVSLIEAMTFQNPVLMVVEDVHWSDPSTLELISLLIEQLRSARFLLVIIFRPEFVPPWGARAHVTALTLNRLTRKDSAVMIKNLTLGRALPAEIVDQIVAKADGVPLFIEELIKTVLESDLLEDAGDRYVLAGALPALAIPASLQDSLMARLDRLASAKELAQLAATLGRTFSHELMAAVSPVKEKELEEALVGLVKAELIYRRGVPPDARYEFKHALVQEAAYQSLLKTTRQRFHQRIARALEEQFPQTAVSKPELLAHHYTEAKLLERALTYWLKAGQRALGRSANVEAVTHLHKGLESLKTLAESSEKSFRELELQLALGPALMAIKGYAAPEVEPVYARARELCQQVGGPSQLFAATWGLWLNYQQGGQLRQARNLTGDLLSIAETQEDKALRLQGHHAAWATFHRLGELDVCRQHVEQGVGLYDIEEHRSHAYLYGGHDPGVCAQTHAGLVLWCMGFPDRALDRALNGLKLSEQLSHPFSRTDALFGSARVHLFRSEYDSAEARAKEMISLSTEHGFALVRAWGTIIQGSAAVNQEQPGEIIEEMRRGIAVTRDTGAQAHVPYLLSLLVDAYRQTGRVDEGLETVADAFQVIGNTGERNWEAEVHRLKGELLLEHATPDEAEAERCFNQALELATAQGAKSLQLRSAMSLARLWQKQGKHEKGRNLLSPIYDWFTEGSDTTDLHEAKALLGTL